MRHLTTEAFWSKFGDLSEEVQETARKNFELLKSDPNHPSLHFKKVGRFWSARAGLAHRALAVPIEDGYMWVWIGPHDEYERILKR